MQKAIVVSMHAGRLPSCCEVVVSTKNSEIGQIWNARFFNGITNLTRMVVLCKDSSALCRALSNIHIEITSGELKKGPSSASFLPLLISTIRRR
jgi:hypothetical protein